MYNVTLKFRFLCIFLVISSCENNKEASSKDSMKKKICVT